MSRRVIIPPGVLDPNQVNVIQVPKALENSNLPLLVTPARRGLRAQALPNWKDELSRIIDEESQRRHLNARGVKCRRDEAEEARKSRNVTFQNKRTEVPKEMKQVERPTSRATSEYSRMQRNSLPRETSGASSQPSYSRNMYSNTTPYREPLTTPTSPSFPSGNENQECSSPYRPTPPTYPSNRPQSPNLSETEGEGEEEEPVKVLCCNKTPARRVTYVSPMSSKQIDNSPIESQSIEIDAPEGIGERRHVMEKQARQWSQPSPQKAHKHPSSYQSSYGPGYSPVGDFNNEYYPKQFCYSDGYHYDDQYESQDEFHDESY